ncbi:MAG: hypothetical protein JWP27_2360 [Flaviaesturariibacter sp.]|nr:hypothetical protein [Flaviaesturariibacter sp.]
MLKGFPVDEQTRCIHYNSPLDIIALKFPCCGDYYPCFECHEEAAGHAATRWTKADLSTPAILCGACRTELTIGQYLQSHSRCPACAAAFNPRCSNHHHLYFDWLD